MEGRLVAFGDDHAAIVGGGRVVVVRKDGLETRGEARGLLVIWVACGLVGHGLVVSVVMAVDAACSTYPKETPRDPSPQESRRCGR
jgi:hypothetical protein